MLTTLVYRFGSPGKARVIATRSKPTGNAFKPARNALKTAAFRAAQTSLCEDITCALAVPCGESIGFYEADGLVDVTMYDHWRETWRNWPRSLPMRDQYFGWREVLGLFGVMLFQACRCPCSFSASPLSASVVYFLSGFFLALRIGVLFGLARAYPKRPWTYWLSPLFDLPVTLRIIQVALRRRHNWRGRTYVRRKGGVFEPLA